MTNVLLVMADQLRADSLGCYGNPVARTPHLDGLARRGMRFDDHITPNQICSPSRGTLFSGLYARRHGLVHNGIALPESTELITHAFARAGHTTHGIGKFHFQPILAPAELRMPDSNAFWTLQESQNWTGPFYGFARVDLLIGESVASTGGGHYARWLDDVAPDAAKLYGRDRALARPPADFDEVWKCALPASLHYNSWIADRACSFLEHLRSDVPFFLFVSFPDPHHPFTPPAPWCDLVDPRTVPMPTVVPGELDRMPGYISAGVLAEGELPDAHKSYLDFLMSPGAAREQGFMTTTTGLSESTLRCAIAHTYGSVAMIDDAIGRILAALDRAGRRDTTLVAFTSDHGELLGDHGLLRKGPPPYRQLLQVPLIVAGPGVVHGTTDVLTSHVDVKATFLDLLGIAGDRGDGHSFASLLSDGRSGGRAEAFAEYHPRSVPDQYNQTIITRDWRLTVYPRRAGWGELFDRNADPGEHCNLFDERHCAAVRARLSDRLAAEWPPAPDAGGRRVAVY